MGETEEISEIDVDVEHVDLDSKVKDCIKKLISLSVSEDIFSQHAILMNDFGNIDCLLYDIKNNTDDEDDAVNLSDFFNSTIKQVTTGL